MLHQVVKWLKKTNMRTIIVLIIRMERVLRTFTCWLVNPWHYVWPEDVNNWHCQ